MTLASRLLVAALAETGYAVSTRAGLPRLMGGIELELATTAVRLLTIALYWWLFRDLIQNRARIPAFLKRPPVIAGIAVAMAVPCLFQGWSPGGGWGTALVFIATSFVVGLREELLYRAVLLNWLQPRAGTLGALLISIPLFLLYHYGVLPYTVLTVTEMICMSLVLSGVYLRSGSLLAVALIHSFYDAVWFLGPVLAAPLPDAWRPAFLVPAALLVLLAAWGPRRFSMTASNPQ